MAAGKKRSGRIFIILILIIAVGAVLVYLLMTGNVGIPGLSPISTEQPITIVQPQSDMVDIVVAAQAIPRGTLITSDYLTTIKYPQVNLPQGMFFTSMEEAVGTKANMDIHPGVPLTTSMVIAEDGGSMASIDIPAGMTAISIPVSPETSVSFAPQKGDHVMVVGCMLLTDLDTDFQSRLPNNINTTYSPPGMQGEKGTANALSVDPLGEGALGTHGRYELDPATNYFIYLTASEMQRPRLVCQTIIQDAAILQVGMFPSTSETTPVAAEPTPVVEQPQEISSGGIATYSGSITLIVSPQDTLILNYLLLSGSKLSLALRSAGDASTITTDPVTLQYIMEQKNINSPVKLPYNVEPRVDSLVYPGFNDYVLIQP